MEKGLEYVPDTPHGTGPGTSRNGTGERAHPVTNLDDINQEAKFVSSPHFVFTAATVTFKCPGSRQVLIVHNLTTAYHEDFYSLPGGRKRIGDDLRATAIEHTLRETGYSVCLPPAKIPTRAMYPDHPIEESPLDILRTWQNPTTGQDMPHGIDEPLGMSTYQDAAHNCTVVRFYFLAYLEDHYNDEEPQMREPGSDPLTTAEWVDKDVALERMRFKAEKDAIQTAMELETIACDRNRSSRRLSPA